MKYRLIREVCIAAVALFSTASFAGCPQTKAVVFEKRLNIAAPPSTIFSLVSDFKKYPSLFPDSHSKVTIVSAAQESAGVVFDNVAVNKSRFVKSRWTVTEFVRDRLIRMDSDSAGTVIVMLHQVDYDTTEETVIASVPATIQGKDEVFDLYEKEMKALKAACERRTPVDTARR